MAPPRVLLEFGARATGEPAERRTIICDAATYLPQLAFPAAEPRVMLATRTFWEKATAIHVFCRQGRFRGGDRFARHWYDLVRLDDVGIADEAIGDTKLARDVAHHKQLFFAEKGEDGAAIEYAQVVSGGLMLAPGGAAREALGDDYSQMVADGLILGEAPTFDALMGRCAAIAEKANATVPHFANDQG
ncbi:nucleotidyl transferase AbiEii/AbiGii toxin family protein [Sphingopyxis sp. NFH-91]|uniref:nucleotidyl transferase AbiEii/AbiGii toxin family protein n=1 Tax=Sphingopyxis sp. NFH-91 TaxID=2744457 RepID=UPI001F3937DF|nr:nucleotidyl transferase AbiEii/AbiGii toxin family protein [Sphingopyxis sp. NFH-91]